MLLAICLTEMCTHVHKNICTRILIAAIYLLEWQKTEMIDMSISSGMGRLIMGYVFYIQSLKTEDYLYTLIPWKKKLQKKHNPMYLKRNCMVCLKHQTLALSTSGEDSGTEGALGKGRRWTFSHGPFHAFLLVLVYNKNTCELLCTKIFISSKNCSA